MLFCSSDEWAGDKTLVTMGDLGLPKKLLIYIADTYSFISYWFPGIGIIENLLHSTFLGKYWISNYATSCYTQVTIVGIEWNWRRWAVWQLGVCVTQICGLFLCEWSSWLHLSPRKHTKSVRFHIHMFRLTSNHIGLCVPILTVLAKHSATKVFCKGDKG